jgi:hypothetical protein
MRLACFDALCIVMMMAPLHRQAMIWINAVAGEGDADD